jgi:hypothetical protein
MEPNQDFGEPWSAHWTSNDWLPIVRDRRNRHLFDIDSHANTYKDDQKFATRIVTLVNAFAGVPLTRLQADCPPLAMFRSWLAGDDDAAAVAADWILDRRQAEADPTFTGRDVLLTLLSSCRDFLRGYDAECGYLDTVPDGVPVKLMSQLDAVLGVKS